VALGLILMTAIYNGGLYYYNKERAFLYYALMQLFMIGVLFYDSGVAIHMLPLQIPHYLIYYSLSLLTLFFIIMFSHSFLKISKYLPQYIPLSKAIVVLILIDLIYYPVSFIFQWHLHLFVFIYILFLGYLRVRQKDTPSKFFITAWSILFIGILIDEVIESIDYTMFIGSILEAIVLAIALSFQIKEFKKEKDQQEKLLIHQSKLATMGELLGNIAHQWRQPLTRLSYTFMNIEDVEDKKESKILTKEGTEQLEFMSQTIDDFINFYAFNKEKEYFSLAEEITNILNFLHYSEIKINLKIEDDKIIFNYKNELKQVLINILSNAKGILIDRKIKNAQITIIIDVNSITIRDNGGGIKLDNIEKIFEPYFSTKKDGLGIGLYMSKMIIEKNMDGMLTVSNIMDGVEFTIYI